MDLASGLGVILAIVSLVVGFTADGGVLRALLQPTALLIVVGGTLGATLTGTSMKEFLGIFKYVKVAFFHKRKNPLDTIDNLVKLATVVR